MDAADNQKSVRRDQRVEIAFLEGVLRRCPGHEPAMEALGHLYTRSGRYEEGLRMDIEMTRRRPDNPEHWYNLACSFSLVRRTDEAFEALDRAVRLGYRDTEWLLKDEDLKPLHEDPRFQGIVERVRSQ